MERYRKIERINELNKQLRKMYNVRRMVDRPNLTMFWGDGKEETTFFKEDAFLQELHKAMKEIADRQIDSLDQQIDSLLK